jgi:hypothetical protein
MLFAVDLQKYSMSSYVSSWNPTELAVEQYIVDSTETGLLREDVFGGQFFIARQQPRTADGKRADIVAFDEFGNLVIVELKRDIAYLGVETQALQYLAAFSQHRGADLLRHMGVGIEKEMELRHFLRSGEIDDLGQSSRIILVARSFDRALFSMGKWLATKGVGFRCIEYQPVEVNGQHFLSFSVAFDDTPACAFPLAFSTSFKRSPMTFWHNIGVSSDDWWTFLKDTSKITAGFDGAPNDPGEVLLRSYIANDRVVAYASGFGAVGWGEIEKPVYTLIQPGSTDDFLKGDQLHRLSVRWRATASSLNQAVPAKEIFTELGIYHPLRTAVAIDAKAGKALTDILTARFGHR